MNVHTLICLLLFLANGLGRRLRKNDIRRILRQHNYHRQQLANGMYNIAAANMKKMKLNARQELSLLTWSALLQKKTNRLLSCDMLTKNRNRNIDINLGQVYGRRYGNVIKGWFNEIVFFRPEYQMCVRSWQCAHLLKIINANYDRVGCSLKRCSSNRTLFGCLYRESTESFSSYPLYRPGKACTKCEGDSSFCENGLCVPCDSYPSACDCRKTCHKPFIGSGELNNTTCQCKCQFGMGANCDEECHNPEQYQDWDICSLITQEECASPDSDERKLLEEFCRNNVLVEDIRQFKIWPLLR